MENGIAMLFVILKYGLIRHYSEIGLGRTFYLHEKKLLVLWKVVPAACVKVMKAASPDVFE